MAAKWFTQNTDLKDESPTVSLLAESDASKPETFHRMPDHIKKILYLDAPDLILEFDEEPLLAVEISREAGTGHNAFQRFARIAAATENGVPVAYIYPEAVWISRREGERWDQINPLIFEAMERLMQIFSVPALLYYFPSQYRVASGRPTVPKGLLSDPSFHGLPESKDNEMQKFFSFVNELVQICKTKGPRSARSSLLTWSRLTIERRNWMQGEYHSKVGCTREWSPLTACLELPTRVVEDYLGRFAGGANPSLPGARDKTVVYQVGAAFRGDPYTGALAAVDYLKCRLGQTYEDRDKNLVIAWGRVKWDGSTIQVQGNPKIEDFINKVNNVTRGNRCLLGKRYEQLRGLQIPRYYMQTRYGCTFTKSKEIRIYCYFADAILFRDGALWREA